MEKEQGQIQANGKRGRVRRSRAVRRSVQEFPDYAQPIVGEVAQQLAS